MDLPRLAPGNALALGLATWLAATPSAGRAELYKCRQPDGRLTYQQTACAESDEGGALDPHMAPPASGGRQQDYSIESQLEWMQRERQARDEARRRQADAAHRAATAPASQQDAAKCAKARGEVAMWQQKVRNGYRTRDEKAQNESRLAYHQALAERYCD